MAQETIQGNCAACGQLTAIRYAIDPRCDHCTYRGIPAKGIKAWWLDNVIRTDKR